MLVVTEPTEAQIPSGTSEQGLWTWEKKGGKRETNDKYGKASEAFRETFSRAIHLHVVDREHPLPISDLACPPARSVFRYHCDDLARLLRHTNSKSTRCPSVRQASQLKLRNQASSYLERQVAGLGARESVLRSARLLCCLARRRGCGRCHGREKRRRHQSAWTGGRRCRSCWRRWARRRGRVRWPNGS